MQRGTDYRIAAASSSIAKYPDASAIARTTTILGTVTKYAGLGGGALIVFGAHVAIPTALAFIPGPLHIEHFLIVAGAVGAATLAGFCLGVTLFFCGSIAEALGQILRASVDTAINTSMAASADQAQSVSYPQSVPATMDPGAQMQIPIRGADQDRQQVAAGGR